MDELDLIETRSIPYNEPFTRDLVTIGKPITSLLGSADSKGLVGLKNPANIDYINAALQALVATPVLVEEWFLDNTYT